MLSRVLTIGLFLTGGIEVALAARHSKLPVECRDLSLTQGNPISSKTIIFGDTHFKPECHSSYLRCAKALTAGLEPEDIVLLVERAPIGKHVLCEEDTRADWDSFAGSCKGFNIPEQEMMAKRAISLKPKVNLEVGNILSEGAATGQVTTKVGLQTFINKKIIHYKKLISAKEKTHNELFIKFAKKHPNVRKENFHSDNLVDKQENELILKKLEDIQKDLKSGKSFANIMVSLEKESDDAFEALDSLAHDSAAMFSNPNTYFSKSIHQQSSQKKKIVGIIGDKHVNKKLGNAQEKAIVEDLYRELKKHEDENPWAVLSCG